MAYAHKKHRNTTSLCVVQPDGPIWLLGRGDKENGIAELWHQDPKSGVSRAYLFRFSPYVYARLLHSRDGHIWITGLNCQLIRFDPQTARFEYFDYAALFGEKASTVRAFAVAEDGAFDKRKAPPILPHFVTLQGSG